MRAMIPGAVSADATSPYHDVFQYQDNPTVAFQGVYPYVAIALMVAPPLLWFLINFFTKERYSVGKAVGGLFIGLGLAAMVGVVTVVPATSLMDAQANVKAAMIQNLRIQYHAILMVKPSSDFWAVDDSLMNLDQPKEYMLVFPDQKKSGEYMVRFERGTSKPIIVSPTPPVDPASQKELDAVVKQQEAVTYESLSQFKDIDTSKTNASDPKYQALDSALTANLQKKYGLTLVSRQPCPQVQTQGSKGSTFMSTADFPRCYSQPLPYQLQKDGKTGTYTVSWNIETGEPSVSVTTVVPVAPINQQPAGQ